MNSYYIPSIAVACMWIFIVILFVVSALEEGTSLKAAEMIIFMQFATAIVSTLALVSYICLAAPRARACFLHIRGLVRRANASRGESEFDDRVANTANCISAKEVVLKSASGETVMEGLNLGILRGSTVTIMGPNGSGASHLINMILGFERPDSGTFLVDGRDVSTSDPKVLRSGISYANSSLHILRGTLRFNLDPHEAHTDEELLEMCGRLGLTEYVAELPDGLDTNINDAVSSMSGGQKLLVIFARSLLKDVPTYIFDDCLFSLDNETKARVLNLISEVCEGRSVIFHMHDTSTCEFSDEIFVMAGGKIVGRGSHSELLESSELYNDLFKTGQGRYGSWA